MIGDSSACRDLAWRTANEFARWWPAVWSNHSIEPVAPLGTWWSRSLSDERRKNPDGHDGHKHGEPTLDDEHPLWFLELDRHAVPRSLVLQSSAERWRFT
jgi:hypothetical protein